MSAEEREPLRQRRAPPSGFRWRFLLSGLAQERSSLTGVMLPGLGGVWGSPRRLSPEEELSQVLGRLGPPRKGSRPHEGCASEVMMPVLLCCSQYYLEGLGADL